MFTHLSIQPNNIVSILSVSSALWSENKVGSNLSEVGSRLEGKSILLWFIISEVDHEIWTVIIFAMLFVQTQSRLHPVALSCVQRVVVCWQLHNDCTDFYLVCDWNLNTCTIWADLTIRLSWVEIAVNILTREWPTHMKYVDRSLSRYVLKHWQLFRDVSFSHQCGHTCCLFS